MAIPDDDASDVEECQCMQKEEFEVLEVKLSKVLLFGKNGTSNLILLY
jgi:hypothetical protein